MRVPVTAGPHEIAVTFVNDSSSLVEAHRQPPLARFNERRHPRTAPALDQVSISGPYAAKGAADTPSRRKIFVCRADDADADKQLECARTILSTLMRRAYRRPIEKAEVEGPLAFYREGRADGLAAGAQSAKAGDFDAGIGRALSAVLMNPEFLFRVESDPASAKATAGKPPRRRVSHQRSRAGVAAVVLLVEQHSGR